jgi:hypothetical protein
MCRFDTLARPVNSWVIEFPEYWPSQNKLGGNAKLAFQYRRYRYKMEDGMKHYGEHVPSAFAKARRVTMTRKFGKGKRAYDRGNLIGGAKPLVDAMVRYGKIYGDTENWLEDHYKQERSGDDNDWIHILIEEF